MTMHWPHSNHVL